MLNFFVLLNYFGKFDIIIINKIFNFFIKENCLDLRNIMYLIVVVEEMFSSDFFVVIDVTFGGEVRVVD